jgi:HD-GYP domain-containing protein (c-di-GMP phosphodiesterase class II)
MVFAQNIFGEHGEKVYDDGRKISQKEIDTINKLGFPGAYIEDDLSRDLVPEPLVPYELYMNATAALKYFMDLARSQTNAKDKDHDLERQHDVVMPIIDVLLKKKRRVIDYIEAKPFKEYDNFHAVSVMIMSLLCGIEIGLDGKKLYELGVASLLHDIGNAFLPAEILNRPGELSDEEYEIVKQHVQSGYDYLHEYHELSPEASMGALEHHENYDGTGYPNKLKRKQISLVGRIVAVADVYDALVSRRPYRAAKFAGEGLDILEQGADRKFDPDIVNTFVKFVAPYPCGVSVILSSGEKAIVFHNYMESLRRPRLLRIDDSTGQYIDLAKDPNYAKTKVRKIIV